MGSPEGGHLFARQKDAEIRSIVIYQPSGQQRHLWIDPVDGRGTVGIHAATFDGWKLDCSVPPAALANALNKSLRSHG
jgi:hypothetical protein